MPSIAVHDVAQPWASAAPGLTSTAAPGPVPGVPGVRVEADGVPAGSEATLALPAPLDLTAFEELRFWARTDRAGEGTASRPFLAEIGYDDAGDGPADDHHWLVPLGRAHRWEQHRIGLAAERRSAVTRLRLRLLTGLPVRLELAELLAAADAPAADVERALVDRLDHRVRPPGPTVATVLPAPAAATTLVVALSAFRAGNRVAVTDPAAPPGTPATRHDVTAVVHDTGLSRTTLTLDPASPLAGPLPAGSTVTVLAPVVVEDPPLPGVPPPPAPPDPALLVSLTDEREDLARAWSVPQRDSFRRRGAGTACSLRPPPRPILLEYQVVVSSGDRGQALVLRDDVLASVGTQVPLRVGGVELPVASVPAPVRTDRDRVVLAPLVVQVGTRQETGPRVETPWTRTGRVVVAPIDAPADTEGIVLRT